MFKYYNPRLVKQHRSYRIEQICTLFKEKKLHAQTVRDWVKHHGLQTVATKPIVIYGAVLRDFIEKRNGVHKKKLEFHQFKCLKCQEIVSPLNNLISLYKNKNGSIKALAICPPCNNETWRFYKKNEQSKLEETFIINKAAVATIYNQVPSTCKTHLNDIVNKAPSEPSITTEDTS